MRGQHGCCCGDDSRTHALNVIKELSNIDREFDKAELKLKIADLAGRVGSMQIALTEAAGLLSEKDKEISALKRSLQIVPDLVECDGFFYGKNTKGEPNGHPFCPRCHAIDGKFMRTVRGARMEVSICPECKNEYYAVSTEWQNWQSHSKVVQAKTDYDPFAWFHNAGEGKWSR